MIRAIIWIVIWILVGASISNWIHKYLTFLPQM
jgi:hypothetical protein